MEYTQFGRTALHVSKISYGTWQFGGDWGHIEREQREEGSVLLEGLEVAFIVISFGSGGSSGIGMAAIGAAAAGVLVILVGALVRAPLQRIPENTLKFIVGIMLTTFGTFWSGESFGINWPFSDLFLLLLAALYLVVSALLITAIKQHQQRGASATMASKAYRLSQEKEIRL